MTLLLVKRARYLLAGVLCRRLLVLLQLGSDGQHDAGCGQQEARRRVCRARWGCCYQPWPALWAAFAAAISLGAALRHSGGGFHGFLCSGLGNLPLDRVISLPAPCHLPLPITSAALSSAETMLSAPSTQLRCVEQAGVYQQAVLHYRCQHADGLSDQFSLQCVEHRGSTCRQHRAPVWLLHDDGDVERHGGRHRRRWQHGGAAFNPPEVRRLARFRLRLSTGKASSIGPRHYALMSTSTRPTEGDCCRLAQDCNHLKRRLCIKGAFLCGGNRCRA